MTAELSFPDDWPDEWPRTAENLALIEDSHEESRRMLAPVVALFEEMRAKQQRLFDTLPRHIREAKYRIRDVLTPEQLQYARELDKRGLGVVFLNGALAVAHSGLHRNTTDRIRTAWKQYEARKLSKETGKIGTALIDVIIARYDAGDNLWRRLIGEKGKNPAWAIIKWLPRVEIKELIEEIPAINVLMPVALTVARYFYDPSDFVETRGEHESKVDYENRCRVERVKISHETLADELAEYFDDTSNENPFEEEDPDFLVNLEAAREVIRDTSAENILGIIRAIPIGKLLSDV
ncbi:MAG: hypothetical protein FP825_06885 [Hyphomonas sp.]|uniref:hypothetical protein n=1 Tax=Hyphomonas sp. TaxID=87 RepID=UPI0017E1D22A|nr:hypothetical protein [Hyphomonas sp.]MBA3068186.1 hypothetical protein [Hyphomonas sp.]MBU3919200.1 hypothetical protein [Alphaproteobacteria bacterium]MBU4062108.1 hypothetical protein [Alphaproteobacteria bacterium]MBU4165543.1 hypothetical protein [Alphaproteobacteria bacterium]